MIIRQLLGLASRIDRTETTNVFWEAKNWILCVSLNIFDSLQNPDWGNSTSLYRFSCLLSCNPNLNMRSSWRNCMEPEMIEIKLHWIGSIPRTSVNDLHKRFWGISQSDPPIGDVSGTLRTQSFIRNSHFQKSANIIHTKGYPSCLQVLVCKVQSFKHCSNLWEWEGVEPLTSQKLNLFRAASKGRPAGTRGHWIHLVKRLHAPFMVFGVTYGIRVTFPSFEVYAGWLR